MKAGDSVSFIIAAGSTGQSNSEFSRFLGIAIRSNIVVAGCIYIARNRGYIDDIDFDQLYLLCEELLVMINAVRNSLK